MSNIPPKVISHLIQEANQDPQLPRENPTEAFWQLPPSPLSTHQSPALPAQTTYAIIGSGVTGCSVAKTLLENLPSDSQATVTVLEARSLSSGATGRNGGHLVSPLPEEFTSFEKYLGKEETTKVARFANRTLESMYALAEEDEELSRVSEARRVKSVCAIYDQELFEETKKSVLRYEECLPEQKGDNEFFGPDEARDKWNMKDAVGVITNSAGAFWPYRLITGLFSRLLSRYPTRFFLETQTPVTSISPTASSNPEYPYTLHTPRGPLLATNIIHCTNGYTSHLLPSLRGKIWPLRGTMSVQTPAPSFPKDINNPNKTTSFLKSWSTLTKSHYDASTGQFEYGLYYVTQNAHSGDLFVGGERQLLENELLTSDDTQTSAISEATLRSVLGRIYEKGGGGGEQEQEQEQVVVKSLWSGIMGFTPDHVPWVGKLPESVASHHGHYLREYIAAGFNGYGMPLCWGCGEAVAKMLLGQQDEISEWFPGSFMITEQRLASPWTSTEAGIYNMLVQEPPLSVRERLASCREELS
ncbi:DAO-domain-containing protein [Sphaerulina musiva SO2202]|uniref:DAO-domain-containing protein n=1 Tax=Sphaerulina musiva (strain SO2202) TaxID=692275 RepID=M3CW75_SPHMS|nr:DAO-domain-containing protein [Sphaerulina musiva SO2202]EMF08392.1 DAO-domain-containing protein [Sphaerulina musiva SO2202]